MTVRARTGSVDRDGVRIHYEVRGAGGVPLLFTHGFAAASGMFASVADALARDGEVITWDLRGHGQSDYPDDPDAYSVPLTVGDMVAVLDAVDVDRAVIAGHSVGGYLSLEFLLAHPERVAALVLIDTGPGYRRDEARDKWNDMAEAYATSFVDRGLEALGDSEELDPAAHRDSFGLVHAARGILVQHDARVIESVPQISVPTLVIVGENDRNYLQSADYFAAKIPDAHLVVISGAGHAPNLSSPAVFEAAVRGFLLTVDAP
jgi:pimeloyl-ACP methyl ester carboxylesterase